MATVISLKEVIDAIEVQMDESVSYLNPDTGEIIAVGEEERTIVEEERGEEEIPQWQQEMMPKIRQALKSDKMLVLPTKFDVHEWSIMQQFALAQKDERTARELNDAVHGAGAFRMFRSAIRRLGIEQNWYNFRNEALKRIAIEWLEEHQLRYK